MKASSIRKRHKLLFPSDKKSTKKKYFYKNPLHFHKLGTIISKATMEAGTVSAPTEKRRLVQAAVRSRPRPLPEHAVKAAGRRPLTRR